MTKLSSLHCGTYRRERWELFGSDRGQWLRIKEYDKEIDCKNAFNDPTIRGAYKDGLAWTVRVVVESRTIKDATVPMFQVVARLKGEDGEEGELVKSDAPDMVTGFQIVAETKADPMFQDAWLVDISTGRTVENNC